MSRENRNHRSARKANTAATIIQRHLRGHLVRTRLSQQVRAAILIQANVRGYLARLHVKPLLSEARRLHELGAQLDRTRHRIVEREKEMELLRTVGGDVTVWEEKRRNDSSLVLQRWWRGVLVRRRLMDPKWIAETKTQDSEEEDAHEAKIEEENVDLSGTFDRIRAHLQSRRRNPSAAAARTKSPVIIPPLTPSLSIIRPLIRQIDSYIDYIDTTAMNIRNGTDNPVGRIQVHLAPGEVRKEHLKAHKWARGRWWECVSEDGNLDDWNIDRLFVDGVEHVSS